ncbi:nuclease [Brevibacillus laterosporus]|uniref:nuclease n=1 Tax=Brevibacillus laterosporus TaxID=1465 RepID=UPI001EF7A8A7|nr:nuclease [Brevibacillus laterosporus]
MITIGDKSYIGKDSRIHKKTRCREHNWQLKKGIHHNIKMQKAFNENKNIEYNELEIFEDIDDNALCQYEIYYINKYGTYLNGYNGTTGGIGGNGLIISDEEKLRRSERISGENNPQSKISDEDFFKVVDMLKAGKTNQEIAKAFNLHDRYVSLIRHKKRFKKLWKTISDYTPIKSEGQLINQGKVSETSFIEIVHKIKKGATNASIEREYGLSSGTGSRIRNKKLYKQWWKRLFNE